MVFYDVIESCCVKVSVCDPARELRVPDAGMAAQELSVLPSETRELLGFGESKGSTLGLRGVLEGYVNNQRRTQRKWNAPISYYCLG